MRRSLSIPRFLLPALLVVLCSLPIRAAGPPRQVGQSDDRLSKMIANIEGGILRRNVSAFDGYFASRLYLHIRDGEDGYFSANQAALVLKHYFSGGRSLTFHFSSTQLNDRDASATGGGTVMVQGKSQIIQVYVAFARTHGAWAITQFNIF